MTLECYGKRRTPKERAAIILAEWLSDWNPEGWTPEHVPGDATTDRERELVVEQVERYRERIYKLLRREPRARYWERRNGDAL